MIRKKLLYLLLLMKVIITNSFKIEESPYGGSSMKINITNYETPPKNTIPTPSLPLLH